MSHDLVKAVLCSFSLGSLLPLPVHTGDHGQGEGGEVEAVAAPGTAGQGAEVEVCSRNLFPLPLVPPKIKM